MKIGTGVKAMLRFCLNSLSGCYVVHQLFTDLKKAYESVGREVLYNILIEFGVPRLIKMCLNETYSAVCIGKHLSDSFPIQNGLITAAFQL
jgi:hypothetical protein